jgi:hypothetical protein
MTPMCTYTQVGALGPSLSSSYIYSLSFTVLVPSTYCICDLSLTWVLFSLSFPCFGRGKWKKEFRTWAAFISVELYVCEDFITVIKELQVWGTSGTLVLKYAKTLTEVKLCMKLNHGNFTWIFSLPWCRDWAMIKYCHLFLIHFHLICFSFPSLALCKSFSGILGIVFLDSHSFPSCFAVVCYFHYWKFYGSTLCNHIFMCIIFAVAQARSLRANLHFYFLASSHQILLTKCLPCSQINFPSTAQENLA